MDTTVCNCEDYTYRSAISLNNVGCFLLEKGAFEQARETFTDCLYLLQRIASLDQLVLTEDYSFHLQAKLMRKASQRMAFPRATKIPYTRSPSIDTGCSSTGHGSDRVVLPSRWNIMSMCERNEFTAMDEIVCACSEKHLKQDDNIVICSFRIEDVSPTSHGSNLGKVLFNLGTSYAALARCCKNSDALQTFAIKVFLLADRSLHLSLQSWYFPEDPERNHNNAAARSIACARLATLHAMLQICLACGNDTVDDIVHRMHELHNAIRINERLLQRFDGMSGPEKAAPASSDYILPAASA